MNNIYKYKIPLISFLADSYAIIIALGALLLPILIALKYGLKGTSIFILIFILIVVIIIVPFSIFISSNEILNFLENRRNPYIIVNDESILLPFEEEKQRVNIFFKDIVVCKERYTFYKKNKYYFIYISQKKNKGEDNPRSYRILKKYMNKKEYEQLKDLLVAKINSHNVK